MKAVRIGCSGFSYRDWRGVLYSEDLPQTRWLERYSEVFGTVELNATFYRLPTEKSVAGWLERTPEEFVFAVKASRYLTHVKRLGDMKSGVARFWERIERMADSPKMGPVLWQLPETFRRDDERLAGALAKLPSGRHCFEFRHESWFTPDVYSLLRERDVALVIGDHPQRPFQSHEITAGFTYVRFHHGARGRNGNYSHSEIETWGRRIAAWRSRIDVYAYFNNDWKGYAVRNARRLQRHLSDAG